MFLASCGDDDSSKSAAESTTSTTSGTSSGSSSLDTEHPFVYLFSADFTGAIEPYTQAELAGLKAAVQDINDNGGINGREVKLETQNDQNDATQAVSLLQKRLSSGDKPDAMYPGGSSAVTLALLPILTQNKILSTDATSSDALNDPEKYPYHFGDSQLASAPLPAFVSEFDKQGYKKIALIFANNETGQATEGAFSKTIKAAGMDFVSASYDEKALDMTPQLQQLKAENPDALIVSGFGTPALYILKSRNQMGWTDIPTYADQLAAGSQYTKNFKPEELKNFFVQTSAAYVADGPAADWPLLQHVLDLVKTEPDGTKTLQTAGAGVMSVGYNALALIKVAADQAKSTDVEALKSAFENLPKPQPVPWLSYGPNGEFGDYNYSSTNHFPTVKPEAFSYVPPGSNNEDGLYVPSGA